MESLFFLSQLSWIFAPHMTADSPRPPKPGMSVCIWGLCSFLMSSYILVTQGASSRVYSVFLLLCEVESCREPLAAVLCITLLLQILGRRSISHPVFPSLEDLRNTGRNTEPAVQTQDCSCTNLNSWWPISQCNGHVLMHQPGFHPACCWHRHRLNC